jgi:hypothetical protein
VCVNIVKIYIASSFDLEDRVIKVVDALEKKGHKIMVKWWLNKDLRNKRDVLSREDFYSNVQCKILYDRDKFGVDNADALILVASEDIIPFGGALVELGMAIERNIPCICMGNLKNSAMYYPIYWVNSISELMKRISEIEDTYNIA